jgi:CubicO group peptidase (beta-lactamase class C family)
MGRQTSDLGLDRMRAHLAQLTAPDQQTPYLNAGYAVIRADGTEAAFVVGHADPDRIMPVTNPDLRLRMASISKAATARAVCALAMRGEMSLNAPITDVLGWRDAPAALRVHPVTIGHLLNHTSGLTDLAGYLIAPGESLTDFVAAHPAAISGRVPGSYFAYANLNYILLGHAMEAATGRRFDHILRDEVLGPAGIAGGFNWAGVPLSARADRLALYQRGPAGLTVQADAPDADWGADLIWRGGGGHSFATYRLAHDTSLLSPHAGLRMSLREAARLARFLADGSAAAYLQGNVTWRYDAQTRNGQDCDGLFTAFGRGLTVYENHPIIASHLIGHAGNALGFAGGVWHNCDTGDSHAYFLTGAIDDTAGLDTEVFYGADECAIMQML